MDVAVIGAGRWGALHAEKLAATPGVRVAAVVDARAERAAAVVARIPGAVALTHLDGLPVRVAAATVAVDLPALADVARAALRRDLHLLVEKPLALSVAEAEGLVREAERRDRVLAVGFVERFNPALAEAPGAPARLVARRVGPGAPGAGPLELDWLVHDLDLACWLLGPGLRVESMRRAEEQVALGLLGPGGRRARLVAARGPDHRRVSRRLRIDGQRIDLAGGGGDALATQLAAFCGAVAGRPDPRLATGRDALAALRLLEAAAVCRAAA